MLRNISNFSNSDKYRAKIHNLIPGGAHTYSKGDDQFPVLSPAAIKYGKGSHVWDIDDNMYLDCSMGLTSVSLGHAYPAVIERVHEELERGVNFQRPASIEMEMAEKFLSLIPCHQMVKFGKNGSTITTAAVKIARAYTGRTLVAFPADHPFYSYDDWFIGQTPCNFGVPEEVSKLSVTYQSKDLNSLKELFLKYPNQIACVITEPERYDGSEPGYLERIIKLTHEYGAVFIQDEMVTGFKTDFPGSIKKYNVEPDIATWGKGIANGFSFCAITGKKEIMSLGGISKTGSPKLFLTSTTHGGETHAIAAGMATIDVFQKESVVQHNHKIGDYFIAKCNEVISKNKISDFVSLEPCNWMPAFTFRDNKNEVSNGMRTYAMQEMIRRGVLFQGAFIPCFSHTTGDVDYFATALNETLIEYVKALDVGYEKLLKGDAAKAVFRKYI